MLEKMVTFGADPDKATSWEETPIVRPFRSKQINELVSAFIYHKHLRMSHQILSEDRAILGQYFSRKLKAGVTPQSLLNLIDAFYASPFSKSNNIVTAFISNTAQDNLVTRIELRTSDEYINWIVDGMPNADFLDDSQDIRKVLLTSCHQGLLRYPGVVIDILKSGAGLSKITKMITSLEELIEWNLNESDTRPDTALLNSLIDLPKELKSIRRGNLRPPAESVPQAILKLKKR